MIGYLLLTFFAAVVYLLFSAGAIRSNPRSARNWLFALALFSLSVWAFCYTWMYAADDVESVKLWYRISALGWIFSPMFYLHFYMVLAKSPSGPLRFLILAGGYIVAVALIVRMQFAPIMAADFIKRDYYWEEVIISPDPWFWLLLFNSFWTIVLGAWLHFRRARRSQRRVEKRQAWIISITIALSALMIYLVNVVLPALHVRPFPSIAIVLNLIPAGIIWWAFHKYDTLALTPGMAADTILEKISDAIVLFDEDGRILSFNRSARNLVGSSIEAGRHVRDLFIEPPSVLEETLSVGEQFQFESTLKLDRPIPVRVEGAAFHNVAGDYMGCSLAIRDIRNIKQLREEINERRHVQEKLEDAMIELKRATRARTDFLTRISHEIRTPMNAILGAGELLADTDLNATQREYLDFSRRAGESLLGLIDNLLDLSRMEAGRFEISKAPFSPHDLAEDVCRILKAEAERKGILLLLEEADVPALLEGDEKSLRQILLNLGGNALKFTENGQVLLRFEVNDQGGRPALVMVVQDTGIGIEPEQMERIFQPFMQGDSSITRRFGRAGLGLAIVRELVDRMDGTMRLKSEPGLFTRFEVSIPVVILEASVKALSEEQPLTLPAIRLLVAEDSPENRQIVAAFLKDQPVLLTFACDGEAAVRCFEEQAFDLVLMDLQMPGVDGYTATRRIRQIEEADHRRRTPVLAFTAHAMSDAAENATEAGCDGVVVKPLRRRKLLESIIQYAASSSSSEQR
ncbi:hybrid sensor histidine kinase/response regulator [Leptonema illini]|uniref:histidine kinase n=1 Tax=Leptonema illini DSM 21528 TaxID=929563 RepID=H2CLS7_9LEPT|nr:ATP-binding protein [Leptonema illini]EHQ04688.1 multi-sensor hybrid histidine kinase [Leptonema illini DSM 21528]